MKKMRILLVTLSILVLLNIVYAEENSVMYLIGEKAAIKAMEELKFEKGDTNILLMTDAGYVPEIEGYTTEEALDGAAITSGASVGKRNLINVHRPYNAPLWFAFFDKESKKCIYLEVDGKAVKTYLDKEDIEGFMKLKDEEIFSKISIENIDADKLLNSPEEWQKKMEAKVFGGNEFSIITIANVWAEDMPWELLKSAEFHNHICPGLTSGYMIAQYLKRELPLGKGEEYQILAVPPWCKDDALQVIFDSTVGKRRMVVKTVEKPVPSGLAGIYIKWNKKEGKGNGVVLTFDWGKACKDAGINRADFKDFKSYKWWWTRLKLDLWMMDYLDKPEYLVSKAAEFDVDGEMLNKLKTAGVNPLEELGFVQKTKEVEVVEKEIPVVPKWVYAVIAILLTTTIISISYAYKKYK